MMAPTKRKKGHEWRTFPAPVDSHEGRSSRYDVLKTADGDWEVDKVEAGRDAAVRFVTVKRLNRLT